MLINFTLRNGAEQILSNVYFISKSKQIELIYYGSGVTSNAKTTRFSEDSNGIV